MVRPKRGARRPDHAILQQRLNELWPIDVQRALERERAGAKLSASEQAGLLALVIGALEDAGEAEVSQGGKPGWVEIKIVNGRFRAYKRWRSRGKIRSQYIGKVGKG